MMRWMYGVLLEDRKRSADLYGCTFKILETFGESESWNLHFQHLHCYRTISAIEYKLFHKAESLAWSCCSCVARPSPACRPPFWCTIGDSSPASGWPVSSRNRHDACRTNTGCNSRPHVGTTTSQHFQIWNWSSSWFNNSTELLFKTWMKALGFSPDG